MDRHGDGDCHMGRPPGLEPRWTSSAKSGVGTALADSSRVWFTLSHGIVNEVYWPRVDQACIRDLGLLVTDGRAFFSEEKRHTVAQVRYLTEGVPAYELVNTCVESRYRVTKRVVADPRRDVLLQHCRFSAEVGELSDYRLYALIAPHLGNRGYGNTAWVGDYKGVSMLFAERDGNALALACSASWANASAGYVGSSDGWQDLARHYKLTWLNKRAENGNVALVGEVDLVPCRGEFTLALGLGRTAAEAGHHARASLLEGFDSALESYTREWQRWQASLSIPALSDVEDSGPDVSKVSSIVLRTHEAKAFPGGIIASLSVPWGFARGDDDLGGYHLVWPRDLAEAAGGLLAIGALDDARRVLDYLYVTQEVDGHWAQNAWLDGSPYWNGIQMDETGFPILLLDLARRNGALSKERVSVFWKMARRAAAYIVQNGPATQQDRWEEDPGYSPFTLAVEVSSLLCAAELAQEQGEGGVAAYLRETADAWNASIERWCYDEGTQLATDLGVNGYYVRIGSVDVSDAASPAGGFVAIKNRPLDQSQEAVERIVSPDALSLVRFGLRSPDDPRVVDTIAVIDALLKKETPFGPSWHRYNDDGYGEHDDGSAFDGTGVGRLWPLLTGERAHFELASGRPDSAKSLLKTMAAFANDSGLIPEQIWDSDDIAERELFFGRPSGSAMPLVWAHAEYLKLVRSIHDGSVFDRPPQTVKRYLVDRSRSSLTIWRFNQKCRTLPSGNTLRVETLSPARVAFSFDGWASTAFVETRDTGLGVQMVDLPTAGLSGGKTVDFTFTWTSTDSQEGASFHVEVV